MGKYLITGASGFIGSNLMQTLLDRNHKVIGIDNRARYDSTIIKGDIRYLDDLITIPEVDAIFHLAAKTGVRDSVNDPSEYMQTNALGSLNILNMARDLGIRKVVMASTSSLYSGAVAPFKEDMRASAPSSPYAASKGAMELLAHSYHHLYGMDITILRYFTVYGPNGRKDMAPYRAVKSLCEGHTFTVYGSGQQGRDWTYVDDIVEGTIKALDVPGFEVINLGRGQSVSLIDMIRTIEYATGDHASLRYVPSSDTDMDNTLADISKASRLMGWTPKVSLLEGISRTVEWYRTQMRKAA